jgi:hypothetical protein
MAYVLAVDLVSSFAGLMEKVITGATGELFYGRAGGHQHNLEV